MASQDIIIDSPQRGVKGELKIELCLTKLFWSCVLSANRRNKITFRAVCVYIDAPVSIAIMRPLSHTSDFHIIRNGDGSIDLVCFQIAGPVEASVLGF